MMQYFSQRRPLVFPLVIYMLIFGSYANVFAQCGPQGCFPSNRPSTTQPISSLPSPIVSSMRSVVRVRHETASGASLGTATLVATRDSECYFATCAHLFDEGVGRTLLLQPNNSSHKAQTAVIVAIDRQHDVALLRSKRCDLLPIKFIDLPRTDVLTACGFGSNGQMRAIRGPIIGQAMPDGASMPSLRMRGSVRPGDSGGPVFDPLGRLVAIVWGERNGETYAIHGGPISRILARIPKPLQNLQSPSLPNAIPKYVPPLTNPSPSKPQLSGPKLSGPMASKPPWLAPLEGRLGSLEASIGESNRKLNELANPTQPIVAKPNAPPPSQNLPVVSPPSYPAVEKPAEEADGDRSFLAKLLAVWKVSEFFLGAVSVGGPVGLALFVSNFWWQRKNKQKQSQSGSPVVTRRPVAVDTPPPPQRIVPETRYVSYEKDEFAKAHQWASEQLARKFPGSVEMLTSLDSLIRQQLAGSRDD